MIEQISATKLNEQREENDGGACDLFHNFIVFCLDVHKH